MKVRCQSPYTVQRRKIVEGREMTRNDSVDHFMCELIVVVEDLVHFRTMTQHTSRLCKGYLTKKESDGALHQMTWTPQSPDLNPIEMVWDELNRRVKEKQPTSAQHMWVLLQDC
uniref:Tc1-like transposase DDE domain-containing protein n=1 Tax=Hucho hucho TaxID=62062 RepID=A0A4W5KUW6_9TELE